MLIVSMNNNGPMTNGLAELNHDMQEEHKEIRDGVTGEGQELSEEDESRINEDVRDVNNGCIEVVEVPTLVPVQFHAQAVAQRPKKQPQGPLVRWERFLPFPSLKVLLVENDDSTRHIVSALLRNCGYEVTAVTNGLQAWKLLEDLTNHIDLVLSEVIMPFLSGIGLLGRIMNHKTCKNIPVIMMSSHDSMNLVFKCLSKGAVDFLVKPIRKNELKNLWQHVWRKCHSSSGSGSGSESGVRTQKSTKSKSPEESNNNSGSNDEDDIGSVGLNARDGSDYGSGTQSSWTKKALEVDSPKTLSPWDQLADPPDSTCAQVIHSRPEAFASNWVPVTTTKECEGPDEKPEDVMGKDLQIGVPRTPNVKFEESSERFLTSIASNKGEKFSELKSKDGEKIDKGQLELDSEKQNKESRNQAADLMCVISNSMDPQIEDYASHGPSNISSTKEKVNHETEEMPSLELSLKRLRDVGDIGMNAHDRNVLRHSDQSAFSRYNSASTTNQAPTGNVGSCSPLDNSSEAAKTGSMQNLQSNSNSMPPNQRSNGSSNNNDMGSTTNNAFMKPVLLSDKQASKSTVKSFNPSSAFQPVQNGHMPLPQPVVEGKPDSAAANTILAQARGMNQHVQVQHHHHHYHHHHHHVHNISQQQQVDTHDDLSLKTLTAAAPQCGSSNVLSTPIGGNGGNQSLNGSASGSNHGSNGQNGSSTTLNPRGTNMESDNGVAGKGGIVELGNNTGIDHNRLAQREAALNKFRQKRKERCFEKKVRYHSRKKLAEQRPRIRGQFVRQVVPEIEDNGAHS